MRENVGRMEGVKVMIWKGMREVVPIIAEHVIDNIARLNLLDNAS
jgi:hypothetical protein